MMANTKQKKIVVIGGGSGLPVILRPLRDRFVDTTAIVTVADNGGSSGIIRDYMNIIPPGDIRNALVALSTMDDTFLKIFQHRFKSDDEFFQNHALGNLIIAAMSEVYDGDIFKAIDKLSNFLLLDGRVFPAAEDPLTLHATMTDGTQVDGEHEITSAHKNIDRIWVTKQDGSEAQTVSEVINAIQSADMVVMGPGSLYTSILPNLMIPQIGKAVARTKAKVVYISNIMTQFGETSSFSDADHVMAIHRNVGEPIIDYVLTNTAQVDENRVDFDVYDEISHQVAVDKKAVDALGVIQVADDFLSMHDGGAFHNGEKIVDKLLDILNEK